MKKILVLFLTTILVFTNFAAVFADTPFQGYTYNFWGTLVPSPAAYVPIRSFGIADMRCGESCALHNDAEFCEEKSHTRFFGFGDKYCGEECGLRPGDSCELEAHEDEICGVVCGLQPGSSCGLRVHRGELNGNFRLFDPTDMHVDSQKNIYVVDNKNHRIIVFDINLNLRRVIETYLRDGEWGYFHYEESEEEESEGVWIENGFNHPHGIFVTDDMQIYIADNLNYRVVVLEVRNGDLRDGELHFVREITAPQGEIEDEIEIEIETEESEDGESETEESEGEESETEESEGEEIGETRRNVGFRPLHVLVDHSGRTFVIVQHEYEGIMSFNSDGEFLGYFGTVRVSFNMIDYIWKEFLMTAEQVPLQNRIIPREFEGMDIDEYGFIFTAHKENWHLNNQIMRLNPRGEDVLVNFNDNVIINGDQDWRDTGFLAGPSKFIDVIARSHGRYSALCQIRGRIFTYDSEGNLLYVFGGTGNLQGMANTSRAVSIEEYGDDILLLDAHGSGKIIHYQPTEYGRLINTAIEMRYEGKERYAVDYWRQLVKLDENFALAWSGIGRSYLARGENETAMEYLRQGMDVRYYSIAFRRHRLDRMQDILPNVLSGGLGILVLYSCFKVVRKIRRKGANAE
jgi:hypothetical protein